MKPFGNTTGAETATILTATEINRLAQRLSQTPLGRSASVAAAADRFQRLLAAQIGPSRAADVARSILTPRHSMAASTTASGISNSVKSLSSPDSASAAGRRAANSLPMRQAATASAASVGWSRTAPSPPFGITVPTSMPWRRLTSARPRFRSPASSK
jgi:hypothetical protein